MSHWPDDVYEGVSFDTLVIASLRLQAQDKVAEAWLPFRRSSIYGPFSYYSGLKHGELFLIFFRDYPDQLYGNHHCCIHYS